MQAHPYLYFDGRCAEAFKFYEECLGGKIEFLQTYGESPIGDQCNPEWKHYIMHIRMTVGETVLMGSDSPPEYYRAPGGYRVSLSCATAEEAERVFAALADGGSIAMPLGETFWSNRFGMLEDRFGANWMVNCEKAI